MRKDLNLDIDLTLEPRYTKEFVVKKQDSINLCISLKNNNIPVPVEGQVPRLYVRKQDGSVVVQGGTEELGDGSIYLVGNTVIIKLKNSAVNATGLCYAELELEDESGITITQSFLFEVIDRLVDTDTPIKAVDDIYLLAEVEKFIIQAKKDLAEIRELINTLDNNVKEAVEYFNSKVVEVDTAINQRLNDAKAEIDTVKENTKTEIDAVKTETIETITNIKNESLEEINTRKEEIIDTMETLQGEIIIKVDEVSENHLRALETARDTHLEELEAKSLEEQEKIVAKGDEKVSEIVSKGNEKVSEIEITANNKLNELREADETLNETIRISNIAGNNLEAIRQSAIEIKNQLDTSKEEGQTVANLLNNLMDNCEAMRKALQIENDEAVLNMEELRPLNGEADIRIIELRDLIQQAIDIAIPALKAYIAEHTPAEDLTQVNAQLEELYNAVRELDIRFNNYYTREEVDSKIDEKISLIDLSDFYNKEEVDKKFENKGIVGISKLPACFTFAPEAGEEVKHIIWAKDRDGYCYVIHITVPSVSYHEMYLGSSLSQLKFYGREYIAYKWNGEEWVVVNLSSPTISMPYQERGITTSAILELIRNEHLFYCTLPVRQDGYSSYYFKEPIEKPNADICGDYNEVVLKGIYRISHSEEIPNCPESVIEEGILDVKTVKNDINNIITVYQEVKTTNEKVYSRLRRNNNWSEWIEGGASDIDLSNYYNKQETDNKIDEKISTIELPEIDMSNYYNKAEIDAKLVKEIGAIKSGDPNFKEPVWDVLPTNTFVNIPANPDPTTYKWEMKCTHYGYHMVFYFPIDPTGKFGIVKRTDGKLGFKLLDNSFKYTTYKSYYKEKNSSKNWSNMPSDNHFTNPTKRELEAIYSHNFDIVDGDNPNVIFRYGSQNDFDAEPIKDFNDATELEIYTVNATESGIIENSPFTGTFKGVLDVVEANGFIEQTLKDINSDTSYFRRFDKTSWSEWRPNTIIEYGEHIIEAPATLEEDEEIDLLSITRGTIKDNDKYYARIAPTKRFTKVTGVTLASDLADLIIGFELNLNAVLINNSKDFMLFMKNNFKTDDSGYKGYEGLNMLMGRKIKYTIVGY